MRAWGARDPGSTPGTPTYSKNRFQERFFEWSCPFPEESSEKNPSGCPQFPTKAEKNIGLPQKTFDPESYRKVMAGPLSL